MNAPVPRSAFGQSGARRAEQGDYGFLNRNNCRVGTRRLFARAPVPSISVSTADNADAPLAPKGKVVPWGENQKRSHPYETRVRGLDMVAPNGDRDPETNARRTHIAAIVCHWTGETNAVGVKP